MFSLLSLIRLLLIVSFIDRSHNIVIRNLPETDAEEYRYNKLIARVFNINRGSFAQANVAGIACPKGECVQRQFCDAQGFLKPSDDILFEPRMSPEKEESSEKMCHGPDEVCCMRPETDYESGTDVDIPPVQTGCGYQSQSNMFESRILGGTQAKAGKFPWMIAILRKISDEMFMYSAGGSLIHPSVVLTTAHSVVNMDKNKMVIRAGAWDMKKPGAGQEYEERLVKRVIIHTRFDRRTLVNDVALLILDKPLPIRRNINTICLPPANVFTDPGVRCIATGWGRNQLGQDSHYQSIMREVDLPVVSHAKCQKTLRETNSAPNFRLHKGFMCAGGESGRDACKGDGGSPLICSVPNSPGRYYQAGIVAGGIKCGGPVPGIYVNVAWYIDWIQRHLQHIQLNLNSDNILRFRDFYDEFGK